ncbi:hypothetical protein LXT12_23070 [Pelomonas sp. P7]|uniref:Uncharacterized protein n=1 Tax=Pelomonas caseinilytica TaxID=2906763 RepID=A0ABS8XM29_9BURK|nr:hypothetical protein [Pelomonas sp. P7]MCE4540138.1 hypothetical protein [Pelomonas sp. P7]
MASSKGRLPRDAAVEDKRLIATIARKLLSYAADNPAKTLSLTVLSYGGVLLLLYFARIGFLPDVNLEALASVLYAVALLGLLLAGYTATTLVMPGMFLGLSRDGNAAIEDHHVWLVAGAVAAAWGLLMVGILYDWNGWFWFLTASATVIYALLLAREARKAERPAEAPPGLFGVARAPWRWMLAASLGCGALMLLPLALLSILGLNGDIARADNTKTMLSLGMTVVAIAAAAGLLGSIEERWRWRAALVIAPVLLFWVSVLLGSFSAISVIAVNRFGLGEYAFVRAIVSGKTCKQVNQAVGQAVCNAATEDDAPTAICPVLLRSRIGSQVVLDFAGLALKLKGPSGNPAHLVWSTPAGQIVAPENEPLFRRVVLPKEQLLTWSSLPQQVSSATSAPASEALASWLPPSMGGAAQPKAQADALAAICGHPSAPAAAPDKAASGPSAAASGPTLIQIDAKGSASHQTVLNLTLSNALSQSASSTSGAAASSKAHTRAAGAPVRCAPVRRCCEPAPAEPQPAACAASAAH